jgi:hypothetical protein
MKHIVEASQTSELSIDTDADGSGVILQSTDVSAALRRNERLRSAGATKTKDGDHFAASIPIDLLNAWAMKRGTTWEIVAADNKMLDQFLAEHSKCRIYEGRI